jgi:hypothetical protein
MAWTTASGTFRLIKISAPFIGCRGAVGCIS